MKKVFHAKVYPVYHLVGGREVIVNFRGYYTLVENGVRKWKALGTPNREIAQKRIMELALQAQRVQEGMAAPDSQREAAGKQIGELFADYEKYLTGKLGCAKKHVHDTTTRLKRMAREISWRAVNDIRADRFESWIADLTCSAKTKKEYQVSACAFLNWLVSTKRLGINPLAGLSQIDTRGKQVRESRSYTEGELLKLFEVAGQYRSGYAKGTT